jgi:hypothetical protein
LTPAGLRSQKRRKIPAAAAFNTESAAIVRGSEPMLWKPASLFCLLCVPAWADDEAPGKRVALLVGINVYAKPVFENHKYAERDVEEVGREPVCVVLTQEYVIVICSGRCDRDRLSSDQHASCRHPIDTPADGALRPLPVGRG